jgi:putative SOS response-associated peptidase YedK
MCGRYVTPAIAAMEREWHVGRHNWLSWFLSAFNVSPASFVPIVIETEDGEHEILRARWGLIPHWWKDKTLPSRTFNARSEEAAQKPMWRSGLKSRRCLMPARGWYEWNEKESALTPSGKAGSQPYFIESPGRDVIAFAGLWAQWNRAEGDPVVSCAVLTRDAAASIAHIHHRMPIVLKPEHYGEWLDPKTSPERVQQIIEAAVTELTGYAVSTRVNNPRNQGPELIEPLRETG